MNKNRPEVIEIKLFLGIKRLPERAIPFDMKAVSAAACLIIAVIVHVSYVIKDLPQGLVLWGLEEEPPGFLGPGEESPCNHRNLLFLVIVIHERGDQVQVQGQRKNKFRKLGKLLDLDLGLNVVGDQKAIVKLTPAHQEEWEPWADIDFERQ